MLHAMPGDLARMIAGRFVLLVGSILFLIYDNEAEPLQRGKDRRPCADHHARRAGTYPVPLVKAFSRRHAAVQQSHLIGKMRGGNPAQHGREADLGHQQHGTVAGLEHFGDEPQVNLRLAAARDSVQKAARALAAEDRSSAAARRPHAARG